MWIQTKRTTLWMCLPSSRVIGLWTGLVDWTLDWTLDWTRGLRFELVTVLQLHNLGSFPERKHVHRESLVSFLTWAWRTQNRTRVFRTERQHFSHCSTNYSFNTRCQSPRDQTEHKKCISMSMYCNMSADLVIFIRVSYRILSWVGGGGTGW